MQRVGGVLLLSSFPGEVRFSLFEEGARSLGGILRAHDIHPQFLLDDECLILGQAFSLAQGGKDGLDGQWTVASDPTGNFPGSR